MAMRDGTIVTVALVVFLLLVVLAGLNGAFDASGEEGGSAGVPMPAIAMAQGDSCVGDTEFMRRNHMTVLQAQHDETFETGVISSPYSIKECVACHAVKGPEGRIVSADSPEHFCRTCHDYAAVEIDCFDCHRSRLRRR